MLMKTAEEVNAEPHSATPMELACAANENLARAIRDAIERDNGAALRMALKALKTNVEMMQGWLDKAAH